VVTAALPRATTERYVCAAAGKRPLAEMFNALHKTACPSQLTLSLSRSQALMDLWNCAGTLGTRLLPFACS
jgi:hypothetical protein